LLAAGALQLDRLLWRWALRHGTFALVARSAATTGLAAACSNNRIGALGSNDGTGLVVGGQLGCNYQLSTWVFGIQGDAA
jgi:hypothetical protein